MYLIFLDAIMRPDPRRDTLTVNEELVVNSQVQDSIPKPNLPFGSNSRLSPAYYSENEDYTSNSGRYKRKLTTIELSYKFS